MAFPKRGEIWFVLLEPVVGREIGKTRPALIISNDRNNEFADTVTVLPITSKTERVYPFETFISKEESKLKKDSKIKSNQIRTIDKKRLGKFISSISKVTLKEVEQATRIHLCITM